jgi:hypothetical protein
MAPVEASKLKPDGKAPAEIVNVTGAVPPLVATVWLYAVLMSGTGSVAVVIESAETIVPLYACDAVTEFASVALIVKLYAPAVVGVPLMAPVDVSKLRPAGNAPAETENAIGAVPPLVATV